MALEPLGVEGRVDVAAGLGSARGLTATSRVELIQGEGEGGRRRKGAVGGHTRVKRHVFMVSCMVVTLVIACQPKNRMPLS